MCRPGLGLTARAVSVPQNGFCQPAAAAVPTAVVPVVKVGLSKLPSQLMMDRG